MTIFVVNNSIDAVLSALFVSFVDKVKPDEIVDRNTYQPRFDAYVKEIATDKIKAERVKKALFNYGGSDIIALMKICLSSCSFSALTIAFNYAHLTLKERTDVSERLGEMAVSDFSFTVQKVLHERHILTGMLRFKESSNGVLYAQYTPDNDVTYLLAPHFLRRLGHRAFVIHDLKRNKIAISNGKSIKIDYTDLPVCFTPNENENAVNILWKKYYSDVNIKERKNERQRDNFFPRRYRKFCFETWED